MIVSLNSQSHWKGRASTAARLNYKLRAAAGRKIDLLLAQETWMYADDRTGHLLGLTYQCAGRERAGPGLERVSAKGSGLLALVGPHAEWDTAVTAHRTPNDRIQTMQVRAAAPLFIVNVYGPVAGRT